MFDAETLGVLAVGYLIGLTCIAVLLPIFKQSYKDIGKRELVHHLWMWNPMAAKEFGEYIIHLNPDDGSE